MTAPTPPRWVSPARALGVILVVTSALLPAWCVYSQSIAAMAKEQTVSLRELRPVMLELPTGVFQMGRAADHTVVDPRTLYANELPVHQVEITQVFAISETEVTQAQYQAVMGTNPSHFAGKADSARRPVESVSWYDAIAYCNKLSEREGLTPCYEVAGRVVKWPQGVRCSGYRLPTEAEWEYAARAKEGTLYAGSNKAEEVAWFAKNSNSETHEVKSPSKKPNQWGLYDLSGNVWEWVWDEYGEYKAAESKDPTGPLLGGSLPVIRGGSWNFTAPDARVARRHTDAPSFRFSYLGFRFVRSYP